MKTRPLPEAVGTLAPSWWAGTGSWSFGAPPGPTGRLKGQGAGGSCQGQEPPAGELGCQVRWLGHAARGGGSMGSTARSSRCSTRRPRAAAAAAA